MACALAGCDRQNPPAPQGNGANAATAAAAPAPPGGAPAAGNATAPTTGRLDRSHAGTAAPAVAFQGPDGQPARLAAFRGRPLLVNLWATWCGPCVVEMPSLDALAGRQTDGQGLRVVAISQDSTDARRMVTDFFAAHRFQHLQPYLDSEMGLMFGLHLDTLPTTILYDSQGREVWRMVGMAEWQSDRIARLLLEADAGQARMHFTKRLRQGVREGTITCSVRIQQRPQVKVGGIYAMEEGHILVESIRQIALADVTGDLARRSGFLGIVDLLKVAKHGSGTNVYLIEFQFIPPE